MRHFYDLIGKLNYFVDSHRIENKIRTYFYYRPLIIMGIVGIFALLTAISSFF